MQRIEVEYEENDCMTRIGGAFPYLVINIERLADLKKTHLSHCDLMYVRYDSGKCNVYLVELKNIVDPSAIEGIGRHLRNKYEQTKELVAELFKCLKIGNAYYHRVLVIPEDIYDHLAEKEHLAKRVLGMSVGGTNGRAWIARCGHDIFDR